MWYDVQRHVRCSEMGQALAFGTTILNHPESRSLHAMWDALRGERPVPFRAELDAHRIGAKAPFLAILEYVGPSNFRIRIAGDRLNKWFGLELRGMSALSLLDTAARNHFQAALNRVAAEPAVAALHGIARGPENLAARFEMVLLPMRSDFGRVDRVLVGLWLLDAPAMTRGPLRLEPDEFTVAAIETPAEVNPPDPAILEPAAARAHVAPAALRSIEGGMGHAGSGTLPTGETPDTDGTPEPRRRGSHLRLVKKS
jgi:hypothetical protein